LASYWGGLDGSIMFWATLLASFGSVAIIVNRETASGADAVGRGDHLGIEMFFLF
jgi:cytochrome c biogenesis factor